MNKLIVFNHKMSLLDDDMTKYIELTNSIYNNIIILPSNIYLKEFQIKSHHLVGCQNISLFETGNYTGEVSVEQVKSLQIKYVLIGHYERRKYFNETIDDIVKKLQLVSKYQLTPIICVTDNDLESELQKIRDNYSDPIIAYEPSDAIGTGIVTSNEVITEKISIIKQVFSNSKVLYGGSVTSINIDKVLSISNLDGVLIGSRSSQIDFITKMF